MADKSKRFCLFMAAVSIILFWGVRELIRNKDMPAEESPTEPIETAYERELLEDGSLQEQVKNFSLPVNILNHFHEHEDELNAFAEQCYMNREKSDFFFVKNIAGRRFHFRFEDSCGEPDLGGDTAIQEGKYNYITSFMDYAIDSGLVFRDWMLEIQMPAPADEDEYEEKREGNYGPVLKITIYEGERLSISFMYSPYKQPDYSDEFYGPQPCYYIVGTKTTRIDSNWYYSYVVTEMHNYWGPELKDLAFAEGFYSNRETTTIMKRFLTENLRGFLRLYWKYGTDFTRISWCDWGEFRWNEPYNLECDIP